MTKHTRPRRPVWIDERDALAIHHRVLALDGGPAGVRDHALLQSALAKPRQLHAYGDNPDIVDMAAAYAIGIIRNHPFLDGNKRTGFVIGVLFLEINGYRFNATEEAAAQVVLNLAAGQIEDAAFAAWMRANVKRQ
ncbi:MAG: type II toxin-antitoxin system death-on-curing family toxin [Candidatus Acidiferrales bacterium]